MSSFRVESRPRLVKKCTSLVADRWILAADRPSLDESSSFLVAESSIRVESRPLRLEDR